MEPSAVTDEALLDGLQRAAFGYFLAGSRIRPTA